VIKHARDLLHGGLADKRPDSDFSAEEIRKGVKIEFEHVNDRKRAKEIAKDHLAEIPDYYTRLAKMESEAEEEMKGKKGKTKKILITANKPGKTSVNSVKTSALRRAEVLSVMAKEGFGMGGGMLTPYRTKAAAAIQVFNEKTAKKKDKEDKPCPGSKIRSKGKGRGLGRGKGKGPIGIPVGEKEAFHAFLKRALTRDGPAAIIKNASDQERAARVLSAVYKAAQAHAG